MKEHTSDRTISLIGAAIRGVLFGLFLTIVFGGGFFLRDMLDTNPVVFASGDYPLLDEVHTLLKQHYLRPLPEAKTLEYGAIIGMVNTLEDRHTFFIPPAVAQNESEALAGQYGGIGVEVKRDSMGNYVLFPYPDSPAAEAGVRDNDRLIAVDDTEVTHEMPHDDVRRLLRGEVGTQVTITTQHADTDRIESFTVEMAVIQVPSVIWTTLPEAPSFGYINILRFTARTPEETEEALDALDAQDVTAFILDLRHNSGGLLQEAVEVTSLFLDGGPVLYEMHNDGSEEVKKATSGARVPDRPVVVLVDGGSASAAELVAGALQDRDRAVLIGQPTYGKGSVQLIFALSDGSSLHVTTAEWLTPDRNPIEEVGLTPDIEMIHTPDFDAELGEAIRYLREHGG